MDDEQATVDEVDMPSESGKDEKSGPEERQPRGRPLFSVVGIILIASAILIGVYGTVAYTAWQRSQQTQADEARTILLQEIDNQLSLAREDISNGNHQLAQRRLNWILERETNHPEALSLMADIESQLALPTPTPRPTATEPPVVEEVDPDDELAPVYSRLRQLVADGSWSEAITELTDFQSEYPNYRRLDTDRLLYDAYVNLGQELLPGDQVELGLSYLARAESLGDLEQAVLDQKLWAELYLQGIAYYGVDWETSAILFRDLCAAAPFYQNSCQKLGDSLMALGDIYAANLDWCPAESYYAEARSYGVSGNVSEKLSEARLMCMEATPTPTAPITETQSVNVTLPVALSLSAEDGAQGNSDG
jgi:hypothetical protein